MDIKRIVGSNVLVEVDNGESKTESGIILLDAEDKEIHPTAVIKMLGSKAAKVKLDANTNLSIGDTVMFQRGHDQEYVSKTECIIDISSIITKL